MIMEESNVQNTVVSEEEAVVEQNLVVANPVECVEIVPVNDIDHMDIAYEAYDLIKKDKRKKRCIKCMVGCISLIAAIFAIIFLKNFISTQITISKQIDAISSAMVAEEYDADVFNNAVSTFNKNTTVSDKRKAKKFYKLGLKAVELNNLNCYKSLFNNGIKLNGSYKEKVTENVYNAMSSAENTENFLSYATYYTSLGGKLDDKSAAKIKAWLVEAISPGNMSKYEKRLKVFQSNGLSVDNEINDKIYGVACELYKNKKYAETLEWLKIYKGKEDVKAMRQESTYEYVIQTLFYEIINPDVDDRTEWARIMLSTDEMKNYKQSEGIRLYCEIEDAALSLYRVRNTLTRSQENFIKDRLLFPNTFQFIDKRQTSDYYMKKGDEKDECKICCDYAIAYRAMNRYGYYVSDIYNLTTTYSVDLDGSDYLLAVKIFNNFSVENMLKYARTGEFTNTKITFSY